MLTTVRVRDCTCPGTPHSGGDEVYVAPTLSLQGGLAAERANAEALAETLANAGPKPPGGWNADNADQLAIDMSIRMREKLLVLYVKHGAQGWNFEDESGPIPFDVETILADYSIARLVADKCDELYGEAVTRPLVDRLATLSQRGPMDQSTSPKASTRKRRKSSSPATTAASKR